jgi:hypothetical protein
MHAGEWNLQLPTFRLGWMSARDKEFKRQPCAEERHPGKPALKGYLGLVVSWQRRFKVTLPKTK